MVDTMEGLVKLVRLGGKLTMLSPGILHLIQFILLIRFYEFLKNLQLYFGGSGYLPTT